MTDSNFEPRAFANRVGAWLSQAGPEPDVVVSCRVRLARNLAGFPFVTRLPERQAVELAGKLRESLRERSVDGAELVWVDLPEASNLGRLVLRERHLVSRDLAPVEPHREVPAGRAVTFSVAETTSAMVNEEDHLRLQGLASGLDLSLAFRRVRGFDLMIEESVDLAVSRRLGYLTACPTNVGTGMRASVMLHLPALGLVRTELEKVFTAAQRTGLAVRGMYGEGSRAAGDFYQISNQVTLGRREEDLLADLHSLVPCIVAFERRVRAALQEELGDALADRVQRSLAMLRNASAMPTEIALQNLSNVRLGRALGLLGDLVVDNLDALAVRIQKGHLQAQATDVAEGDLIDAAERDKLRASFLHQQFGAEEL